jgi:hypothetical protein
MCRAKFTHNSDEPQRSCSTVRKIESVSLCHNVIKNSTELSIKKVVGRLRESTEMQSVSVICKRCVLQIQVAAL